MRIATLVSAGCLLAATGVAHAQATAAAGSVVVVPVVAETSSYTTEVIVRNPGTAAINVNIKFYEANNSTTPGLRSCTSLGVAGNASVPFDLASKCSLGAGSHFGMLVLEDAATPKTNVFYAYSRAQTPGGNGFSVEGFPAGAFSGANADVVGLKRQAAAPVYQSNCFIGALGEPLTYQVLLWDGNNNLVGMPITGSLGAYQNIRFLDVFAAANAPAGDQSNVRATFSVTSGAQAMVPFCTVQESTFFGADFRIGKSVDALNNGQRRLACIGIDDCKVSAVSSTQPEQITDVTKKNVYSMIITQPDYVRCDLVSDRLSDLQIRLREWGDPFSSPVFPASAPFSNGGSGNTFFYIYTGGRNAVNSGTASRWFIDVAFRTGGNATVPIDFGITCTSGNGTEVPWLRGVVANDFP
jgi:hypothetical protein